MPSSIAKKLYPIADASFGAWGKWHARGYDLTDTIVIASSGRGGSTWLAEIIASLDGRVVQWEPLHPHNNPEAHEYGFDWQNYMSRREDDSQRREYVRQLLTGERLSTRTLTSLHFKPRAFLRFKGYVIKFVNANMILHWLMTQFPVRGVLLVRHPCAVAASQMAHGSWGFSKDQVTIPNGLFDEYPHYRDAFADVEQTEEILAFVWATQVGVPLSQPRPHPWLLVTYEHLASRGEAEVKRIFDYLGEDVPAGAYETLHRASATTQDGSNVAKGESPLIGWRERLSSQQVENIMNVVRRMGVNLYSEDLMPDADQYATLTCAH